ncbi:hypothetical protein ACWDR0_14155 [Streptomyces sp. NPDC003691]
MHGPGYAPPRQQPPSAVAVVLLRTLFLLLAVLTWGMLAWLTMLRVAVMRRKPVDWLLFVVCCLVTMGLFALMGIWGSDPNTDEVNGADATAILGLGAVGLAVAVHFFVIDLRTQDELRRQWQPAPGYQGGPAAGPAAGQGYGFGPAPQGPGTAATTPGYGYPPQRPGYGYPPVNPVNPVNPAHPAAPGNPAHPGAAAPGSAPGPVPGATGTPAPGTPVPPPPPAAGPRIDQVRAELDELSDYLRKDRGERDR